jgi:hypothetical protein
LKKRWQRLINKLLIALKPVGLVAVGDKQVILKPGSAIKAEIENKLKELLNR